MTAEVLRLLVVASFLVWSLAVGLGQAAEENPPPLYWLEDVTVTAPAISSSIGAFTALDSQRVHLAPGRSASDLLALVPGGMVVIGAKGEASFRLRGSSDRDVKLYIDGRPVANPYYGTVDFAGLSLGDLARASVIKGPAPLSYGPGIGGVVNLVTRGAGEGMGGELQLEGGSGNSYHTSLSQYLRLGRLRLRQTFIAEGRDGFPLSESFDETPIEDGGLRRNSTRHRRAFSMKGELPAGGLDLLFAAGYSFEKRSIPPYVYQDTLNRPRWWKFPEWIRYYADAKATRTMAQTTWRSGLYFDTYRNRLIEYRDPSMPEDNFKYESIHDSKVVGGDLEIERDWSRGITTTLGFRGHGDFFVRTQRDSLTGPWVDTPHQLGEGWLYAEGTYRTASVEVSAGCATLGQVRKEAASSGFLVPRLGAAYLPHPHWKLGINLARSAQFPTFNHLYSQSSGNPDLRPEHAWRGEVGGQWMPQRFLSLSLWGFASAVKDRIYREGKGYPYRNIDSINIAGVEFSTEVRSKHLQAGLAAVYANTDLGFEETPPVKVDGWVVVKPLVGATVSVVGNWADERDDDRGDTIKPHSVLNAAVSYDLFSWMTLRGALDNIFDADYEEEYGFPMPGRVWRLGCNLTMK